MTAPDTATKRADLLATTGAFLRGTEVGAWISPRYPATSCRCSSFAASATPLACTWSRPAGVLGNAATPACAQPSLLLGEAARRFPRLRIATSQPDVRSECVASTTPWQCSRARSWSFRRRP